MMKALYGTGYFDMNYSAQIAQLGTDLTTAFARITELEARIKDLESGVSAVWVITDHRIPCGDGPFTEEQVEDILAESIMADWKFRFMLDGRLMIAKEFGTELHVKQIGHRIGSSAEKMF